MTDNGTIRRFTTGATRDTAQDKLDFEGFLCPFVLERYAQYMHKNRKMADGSLRDSDNWQKGIPKDVYMKSMTRHFMEVWREYRSATCQEVSSETLCALLFNVMGMLHEVLKVEGKCRPDGIPRSEIDAMTERDLTLKAPVLLAQAQAEAARKYDARNVVDRHPDF